jgi:hypothetical protein
MMPLAFFEFSTPSFLDEEDFPAHVTLSSLPTRHPLPSPGLLMSAEGVSLPLNLIAGSRAPGLRVCSSVSSAGRKQEDVCHIDYVVDL